MKLLYRIASRICLALLVLFGMWAAVFYYIIIDEINDETDDALEEYSEYIITRALAGEPLPEEGDGTNNYYITEVTDEYAAANPGIKYTDETMRFINKTEPVRMLRTIYSDAGGRFYEVAVYIPTIKKADLQEKIMWWMIVLYVLLMVAIATIGSWVLHRNLRPLYALLEWLDEVKLGSVIPPLDNGTKVTEFRKLNEALMRSARRNAEVYEQQRLFIGHASHELQTPIAIAHNRLELLAADTSLSEGQLEQVLKTKQSLMQIAKLNKSLLLLTKIENKQFQDKVIINANRLLRSLLDDFSEAYGFMGVSVTVDDNRQLDVEMDETLSGVLLGNMLRNAFVHNYDGGSVKITIEERSITICNTSAYGMLDVNRIFERFYQSAKKEGSSGLGLPLVKSICTLYGIELGYDYSGGIHCFILKFPE